MGYSESLKAYRIYFPRFKTIDISKDVTFDEDSAYNKSRKKPTEELEEAEAPKIHDTTMNEEIQEEDREIEEPQEPVGHVDVFVTLKCIHVYILCLVPRCLFREVSIMYLIHTLIFLSGGSIM